MSKFKIKTGQKIRPITPIVAKPKDGLAYDVPADLLVPLMQAYNRREDLLLKVGDLACAHAIAVADLTAARQALEGLAVATRNKLVPPGDTGWYDMDVLPDRITFRKKDLPGGG